MDVRRVVGGSVLELIDLHKRYGSVVALDGLSLQAPRGRLVAFLGPNGAGKTTAMRSVFGLVRLDAGKVLWEGHPVEPATRLRFGYMPEQRGLYPSMKVVDQLAYLGRLHGMTHRDPPTAAVSLLEQFGLGERLEDKLEKLSHGNQQRVQLAAAIVHQPDLLILDEPFSGLDPIGVSSMGSTLRARAEDGAAVVFSSHQLDLVEDLCDDVVIINQGRPVLTGAIDKIRASAHSRRLRVQVAGGGWEPDIPDAELVSRKGDTYTLAVPVDADLAAILTAASTAGKVVRFTFEPPTLSELFAEAVGFVPEDQS